MQIAFIGAGNLSRALISGLIQSGFAATNLIAANRSPEKLHSLKNDFGIQTTTDNLLAVQQADIVILAVKPQQMAELLANLHERGINYQNKLVISLAAGILCARLSEMLGSEAKIIRAMPNTPALIRKGMTGLYAGNDVDAALRGQATQIFAAVGKVLWVKEEAQINAIIAVAGSAPAYLFLFLEAMSLEAERMGFTRDDTRLLLGEMAQGAAGMVLANPEISLTELREQVTSKGGATFEALAVLQQANLFETTANAMQAASQRAKEMEQLF